MKRTAIPAALLSLTIIIGFHGYAAANVFINEIMASNTTVLADEDGDYPDWIELLNAGDSTVNLAGYGLSDREDNPYKWRFPDVTIEAGGFLVVFASGKETSGTTELHANFKISADGETLVLTSPDGSTIDRVPTHVIPTDISWGRKPDEGGDWVLFYEPTPGESNTSQGYTDHAGRVICSHPGGFYSTSVTLELTMDSPGAKIHYTLDGSTPTEESNPYESPLVLAATTVVRARVYEDGKLPGKIATQTYLINANISLPVVSLSTEPANFFDELTGIYVHGNDPGGPFFYPGANFWKDWEKPVHVEMFEPDGTIGFSIDGGVKINGEINRLNLQKSLCIYARNRYGYGSINHRIFPDVPVGEFKSIVLRNSGNDWKYTMIRDGLFQGLFMDRDVEVQGHRPAVVFINGEYFGIHNIRERKNEDYIASHHDVDPDELDILESSASIWKTDITDDDLIVVEGDDEHYAKMMNYLNDNDISDSQHYTYIRTQMDVDNFIETCVAHMFLADWDWPGRNTRIWRPKTQDGKWRWLLFDLDIGMWSEEDVTDDMVRWTLDTAEYQPGTSNAPWSTFLLRKFLENREFEINFINRFADCMNTVFHPVHVTRRIEEMAGVIETEIPRHVDTWTQKVSESYYRTGNPISSVDSWYDNIRMLKDFTSLRPHYMRQHLKDYFGLADTVTVTFVTSLTESGSIHLNSLDLDTFPWTGTYFTDVPVTVTALPNLGYRFVRWEGASTSADTSIELTLTGDTGLTAVFEKTGDSVVIDISKSPYEISRDLVIPQEMTLTVDAGVELVLSEDTSIIVQGALHLNGTAEQPVTIGPASGNDRWGAIVFDNAAGESTISHAVIRNASRGADAIAFPAAVSGFNSDFTVESVRFEDNIQVIFAKSGNVTVKGCAFDGSNEDEPINIKDGWALVEDCRFHDVRAQDAIDYDGVRGGIIRGNEIYGSNDDGIDIGDGCSDILITGNRVSGCFDKAISIGEVSKDITVERNILTGSGYGVAVKDNSTAVIDHTTFYGNNIAIAGYEKGVDAFGGGAATVTNSILANSLTAALMTDDLSAITITYSLADTELLPGVENLLDDPGFLSPEHGGFQLTADSPAVDSGDPGSSPDSDGSRTDMGALVFSPVNSSVVITEINYNSAPDFDSEDWIELYNAGDIAVDLGGWQLRDENDDNVFVLASGTTLEAGGYLVLCRDLAKFQALFPQVDNAFGDFGFGLSNGGDAVRMFDSGGIMADIVVFDDESPWPAASDGSGTTLALKSPGLDNALPENWGYSSGHGTPGRDNAGDVGVDDVEPLAFYLGQNYPNPFNPVTTIPFSISNVSHVKLSVYSVLGQRVATLVDERLSAGKHSVQFDANGLSSGVYLYRIEAGDYRDTASMLVVK